MENWMGKITLTRGKNLSTAVCKASNNADAARSVSRCEIVLTQINDNRNLFIQL